MEVKRFVSLFSENDWSQEAPKAKELVAMVIVLTVLYRVYFFSLINPVNVFLKKNVPNWADLKNRKGSIAINMQDELVLSVLVGAHHLMAGLIMLTGTEGFVVGILIELAFEISDICSIFTTSYPYRPGKDGDKLKRFLILHHIPGVLTIIPVLASGLHLMIPEVRELGFCLEFVGALGIIVSNTSQVIDVNTGAWKIFYLQLLGNSIFVYGRFVYSPPRFITIVNHSYNNGTIFGTIVLLSALTMKYFDCKVLYTNGIKNIKYYKLMNKQKLLQKVKDLNEKSTIQKEANWTKKEIRYLKRQSSSIY